MSFKKVLTTKASTTSTLKLKAELLKWICKRHATNEPLDRKLLRDKAMELATSFGVIGFKGSEAWLTVFLKKHGFSPSLTSCTGPTFADYRVWIDLLRSLITQYRHKDLFNVDELVMYSNFLPVGNRITIPFQQHGDDIFDNHDASRVSSRAKKIAVLLCCNSSGTEKLEPLISYPRALEKSGKDSPRDRPDFASGSSENFVNWLEGFNERMSNSRRNVLLLLSRERIRSLHNFQRLSNVKLVFLPKDFPTQLRPLRGDVFHCVKMTYRRLYVEFARRRERTTREWGTKEIVETIFEAWKDVPQELIVSSFQRTKFREDETSLKIQCPEWDALETGMSFRKFVTFDDELSDPTNRRIYDEARYLTATNNEHRYNLRKSRRDTVELLDDDDDVPAEENPRKIREIDEEIHHRKRLRGPSRQTDHATLRIYERYENANDVSEASGNRDFIETSPIAKTSSDEFDDLVATLTRTGEEGGQTGSAKLEENLRGYPREAGPSGNEWCCSRGSFEAPNSSPRMDFDVDDDEKVRNDDDSRLGISNAIEICDALAGNGEENDFTADDRRFESSKRSRSPPGLEDENFNLEPPKKFAGSAGDWSKRYETNFVFGPEVRESPNEDAPESSKNRESSPSDGSKMSQTGNDEMEKRRILTLEGSSENPPSVSYPRTKD